MLERAAICLSLRVMLHQSLCTSTMCWVDHSIVKLSSMAGGLI